MACLGLGSALSTASLGVPTIRSSKPLAMLYYKIFVIIRLTSSFKRDRFTAALA